MTARTIRKVVIPAAGKGKRFLPATKVVPKEMLPVAGRPLIQYAVEEAAASGIETVILVLSEEKSIISKYFSRDLPLETALARCSQDGMAQAIRHLSELAEVRTAWQERQLGLADAIRSARPLIGDEPFAVILPDALIDASLPCIRQMMDCYERHPGCVVATQTVESSEVTRFGIIDVEALTDRCCGGRTLRVTRLTERPQPGQTTSRYGIFGRYILEPDIFSHIDRTSAGFGNELQLTDSLQLYTRTAPIYAYCFEGKHYDAGNKWGFLQATIAYSLKDPELSQPLREYLAELSPSPADSFL
ncbi:MAG: UTP--glucose-1-phosphate uridylyltransferase [Terriglobales bacterium]